MLFLLSSGSKGESDLQDIPDDCICSNDIVEMEEKVLFLLVIILLSLIDFNRGTNLFRFFLTFLWLPPGVFSNVCNVSFMKKGLFPSTKNCCSSRVGEEGEQPISKMILTTFLINLIYILSNENRAFKNRRSYLNRFKNTIECFN